MLMKGSDLDDSSMMLCKSLVVPVSWANTHSSYTNYPKSLKIKLKDLFDRTLGYKT